jgi:hypothetical protein
MKENTIEEADKQPTAKRAQRNYTMSYRNEYSASGVYGVGGEYGLGGE